jgi:hypothetical protein
MLKYIPFQYEWGRWCLLQEVMETSHLLNEWLYEASLTESSSWVLLWVTEVHAHYPYSIPSFPSPVTHQPWAFLSFPAFLHCPCPSLRLTTCLQPTHTSSLPPSLVLCMCTHRSTSPFKGQTYSLFSHILLVHASSLESQWELTLLLPRSLLFPYNPTFSKAM